MIMIMPMAKTTPPTKYDQSTSCGIARKTVYAVAGIPLLAGKTLRRNLGGLGRALRRVDVPIAVVERARLDKGLNYLGDTLIFCGAVLLLRHAPRIVGRAANRLPNRAAGRWISEPLESRCF